MGASGQTTDTWDNALRERSRSAGPLNLSPSTRGRQGRFLEGPVQDPALLMGVSRSSVSGDEKHDCKG